MNTHVLLFTCSTVNCCTMATEMRPHVNYWWLVGKAISLSLWNVGRTYSFKVQVIFQKHERIIGLFLNGIVALLYMSGVIYFLAFLFSNGSLFSLVVTQSRLLRAGRCWLDRTGFEFNWGWISVAVPVVYLAMHNLWLQLWVALGIKWIDTSYHSLGMQPK